MREEKVIAGLDVGSTAIKMVLGTLIPGMKDRPETLQIVGKVVVPGEGISKGVVTSIEDAVSSVSSAIEQAERIIGKPLGSVWVGMGGAHIKSEISRGVIAVAKGNEIQENDVERALEAARVIASPPNHEILHVIPHGFSIDGQEGVKNPVGFSGVRLEVEAHILQGLSSQINNLVKVVHRTGLEVEDVIVSVLATAESVLTARQKDLGVVLVNIGGSTTSIAVFEEGDIMQVVVLPVGSGHITGDIALGLRCAIDTAEKKKLATGTAESDEVSKHEEVDMSGFDASENARIPRRNITTIIEARVEEIFEMIDDELKKINRSGMLPAGAVLTGGGAKLPGIVAAGKKHLRLPVMLGYPQDRLSTVDDVYDLSLTTAIGLVEWGFASEKRYTRNFGGVFEFFKKYVKTGQKGGVLKKTLKSFIP